MRGRGGVWAARPATRGHSGGPRVGPGPTALRYYADLLFCQCFFAVDIRKPTGAYGADLSSLRPGFSGGAAAAMESSHVDTALTIMAYYRHALFYFCDAGAVELLAIVYSDFRLHFLCRLLHQGACEPGRFGRLSQYDAH